MSTNTLAAFIRQVNESYENERKEAFQQIAKATDVVHQSLLRKEENIQDVESVNMAAREMGYDGAPLEMDPQTNKPRYNPNMWLRTAEDKVNLKSGIESAVAEYGEAYRPDLETSTNLLMHKSTLQKVKRKREVDILRDQITQSGFADKFYDEENKITWAQVMNDPNVDIDKVKTTFSLLDDEGKTKIDLLGITHGQGIKARDEYVAWTKKAGKGASVLAKKEKAAEIKSKYETIADNIRSTSGRSKKENITDLDMLRKKGYTATDALVSTPLGDMPLPMKVEKGETEWKIQLPPGQRSQMNPEGWVYLKNYKNYHVKKVLYKEDKDSIRDTYSESINNNASTEQKNKTTKDTPISMSGATLKTDKDGTLVFD